jgi:TRAP transporter TAXI family solute receptor
MKRRSWKQWVWVLVVVLAIGGSAYDASARDKEFIKIGGGASGGTFFIMASAFCKMVDDEIKWLDATPEVGGSVLNVRRVGTDKLKFGIVTTDTAYHGINGGPEFKDERYPDIRAVFSGHVSYWHMFTLEKSGIKTIEDLKGKRVSIGYPGGSVEVVTREILKEYNLIPDRDFKNYYLTHQEVVTALKDDTLDAGAILTGAPSSVIIDLATTHKVRILPVSPAMQEKITKKFPYYFKDVFKPEIYPGITEAVPALSIGSYLITNKNTTDEMAYDIAKMIGEHTKEWAAIHPAGREWSLDTVKKGFSIPIHPGAMKYFKEKGIKF